MTGRGHTRRDLLRAAGGTASAAVVGTAATGTAAAQTDGPTVVVRDGLVPVGGNGSVPIVLTSAPDGLSGFNLTVSINSGAAVELTNGSVPDSFDLANVTVADGNTRVTLKGADLENATTPGATNVTLATVELRGARVGNATVSVDVSKMDDDDGEMYLDSVHPGVTEKAVQEATGWNLQFGSDVVETEPPGDEEIDLIRNELDPDGVYTQ